MPYIANVDSDRRKMLAAIGVGSMEELWRKAAVNVAPPDLSAIPEGLSEYEVCTRLGTLADRNATKLVNFLGGGYYDHFIPATVDEICSRSEFYTAYTPYQPEASQGTLQAIFEFQSSICRLTGMEVANASMYDGGSALFESMQMSFRLTRKRRAVVSGAVSPIFRRMLSSYSANLDIELVEVPAGTVDSNPQGLLDAVDENTACVMVQYPNFFGTVEDWKAFNDTLREKKIISICSCYPIALGLLKTPGECGFDIVCGEGQSLGIPLSFGGPYLGFMATLKTHMRRMPGRICGRTVDRAGREGFVLTLQAREQHIRRAGAMSNICSNENLCALAALVYMSTVGKQGLVEVAELCAAKAVYAREQLLEINGVEAVGDAPFFNEFVIKLPGDASEIAGRMVDKGFAAGFPLGRYYPERGNQLLVAVTEKRSKEQIKALANALEAVL